MSYEESWGPRPAAAPLFSRPGCLLGLLKGLALLLVTAFMGAAVSAWAALALAAALGLAWYLRSPIAAVVTIAGAWLLLMVESGLRFSPGLVALAAAVALAVLAATLLRRVGALGALLPARLRRRTGPAPGEALEHVREAALLEGGGAYLGAGHGGAQVHADPEHAVLDLGPPRSGKSSAVVVPALLCHVGPAVSTSTKPDVLEATAAARSLFGPCWQFDVAGEGLRPGMRAVRWSPLLGSGDYDGARRMARQMVRAAHHGGEEEGRHWQDRAAALLAPLLHAARLAEGSMADVLRWVQRGDLETPAALLEANAAAVAADALAGIAATAERERSGILSTASGVIGAYESEAIRAASAEADFDPDAFLEENGTLYVTAGAEFRDQVAPLVVGLITDIRLAAYRRARAGRRLSPPLLLALDEVANIAPLHDLPQIVSEGGGQGVQVLACLQDLAQARERWGRPAAEGFLTLFGTKLVHAGIADGYTLEAISRVLGEYDREVATSSVARTPDGWLAERRTYTESYTTRREAVLSPGEIAAPPEGCALLLRGAAWNLVRLTPYWRDSPWTAAVAEAEEEASCGAEELPPAATTVPS